MVAKLVGDQLKFVDGDAVEFSWVQLELEDIPSGTYMVFCRPKWDRCHHCRNIVWSIYINQESKVRRVYYKKFSSAVFGTLEVWLRERLSLGKDYERQQLHDDPKFIDDDKVQNMNNESEEALSEDHKTSEEDDENDSPRTEISNVQRPVKSKAMKDNIFNELVFDLNGESQKETIFLTVPNMIKETFSLQRWKNK